MIQHIWTLPCRFSLANGDTNNVSLIEVIEDISIPLPPPQPPVWGLVPALFDVVTVWARQNDDAPTSGFGRLSIVSPGGESLVHYDYDIDLRENRRVRNIGRVLGFPAREPGRYFFRVEYRINANDAWQQVSNFPIAVNILRPPETQRTESRGTSA
jgi:hypothetical protein